MSGNDHQRDDRVTPAMAVARALSHLHNGIVVPDYEEFLWHGYARFLGGGSVTADVGASLGFHTGKLALFGKVIAFEPIPENAALLRAQFSGQPNVEIREMALGRMKGEQPFYRFPSGHALSGLRLRGDSSETASTIAVRVDTIDNQLAGLDRLDYIKIDVEGGEIDCLRGGRETILRHRPIISTEYGRAGYLPYGHTAETLFLTAQDFGYVISDLFGNMIASCEEWRQVCDVSYWDYFLVPVERREFLRAALTKRAGSS